MTVKNLLLVSTLMASTLAAECPTSTTAPEDEGEITYEVPITFVNKAGTGVTIEWSQGISYVDPYGQETLTIWETRMGQRWEFDFRPASKWGGAIDVNAHCQYGGGSNLRVIYENNRAKCEGW